MTFADYSQHWSSVFLPALKPGSAATLASHVRRLNGCLGSVPLADLTDARVQVAFNGLAAQLSPKTVNDLYGTLHNVLGRAQREGLVTVLPEARLPEVREQRQPWYTVPEVQRLVPASPAPLDTLVYLLAETGLRIGEALSLTDQSVDLTAQTLRVDRTVWRGHLGSTKCKSSDRNLSISKHLQGILSGHLSGLGPGFLFRTTEGTPKWPTTVADQLTGAATAQGLDWRGFHSLRRTNATIMADLGVPEQIADLRQGHSTARGLTYKLYAQRAGLRDREWAEKISEVLVRKPDDVHQNNQVHEIVLFAQDTNDLRLKFEQHVCRMRRKLKVLVRKPTGD